MRIERRPFFKLKHLQILWNSCFCNVRIGVIGIRKLDAYHYAVYVPAFVLKKIKNIQSFRDNLPVLSEMSSEIRLQVVKFYFFTQEFGLG
ncbi:protein of unknown function [Methylocaldum szegediense]|uniref:Uncharacterized protein n=1 Tax=Methylocaldum szegediense TaxID=73780 RepID=A0ABM9I084_9GAMM|nr:protein of unknown function [Methylocaldum szegediense]